MSLSLSPELERQITKKVESGEYASADDVVRHGMQLLCEEEQEQALRIGALREKIQEGIDDLENGRHSPIDEAFARLRALRGMPASR